MGIELAHSEGQFVIHFLWDMRKFYDSIKAHLLIPQLVSSTQVIPSSFQRSPARCRRTLVDQVCDQFVQAMRNSDPRVRIFFVYRFNSDFHSIFTLKVTGCDFQYGSNFGVPLNPTFRVS